MRRFRGSALALALVIALAAGCGASTTGAEATLSDAQEHLSGLDEGRVSLAFGAEGGDGGGVGFTVEGPFRYGDERYPVLDLSYTSTQGGASQVTRVRSDGKAVAVTKGGRTTRLTDDQAAVLRLGDGDPVDDLGVAGWVRDPEERTDGDRTTVTGEVDVADLLADLARVAAGVTGTRLSAPDGDGADRLRELVRDSDITVVTEGDEHHLRRVELSVELEPKAGSELRRSLGSFAGASITLTFEVDELDGPLEVDLPR